MSDMMGDDLERFEKAVNLFNEATKNIQQPLSNSHANISVSAGGIGLWICMLCCILSTLLAVGLGFLYLDQSRKLDHLQDCMNVVLQWAPQLREFIAKGGH